MRNFRAASLIGLLAAVAASALACRPAAAAGDTKPSAPPGTAGAPVTPNEWPTAHGPADFTGAAAGPGPGAGPWQTLWATGAGDPIDVTPVCTDRTIYTVSRNGEVTAFAVADGKPLWAQTLVPPDDLPTPAPPAAEAALPPLRKPAPRATAADEPGASDRPDESDPSDEPDQPAEPTKRIASRTPGVTVAAAPVLIGETLIVAGRAGVVFALATRTGEPLWTVAVEPPVIASLNALARSGQGRPEAPPRCLAVSSAAGIVHCLAATTGAELWRSEAVDRSDCPVAVGDGLLALGSCQGALHVLAPETGEQLRQVVLGDDAQIAAGVAVRGTTAYGRTRSGELLAVNLATGTVQWRVAAGGELLATPCVMGERILIPTDDGKIKAFARGSGRPMWESGEVGDSPSAVVGCGAFAAATADGLLHVLAADTGREVWSVEVADQCPAPAVAGGRLVVCGDDGTVLVAGVAGGDRR